jgi:hypothetical protein
MKTHVIELMNEEDTQKFLKQLNMVSPAMGAKPNTTTPPLDAPKPAPAPIAAPVDATLEMGSL